MNSKARAYAVGLLALAFVGAGLVAALPASSSTNPTASAAGNNCLASPHSCGFPDETNTGYRPTGTRLTHVVNGDLHLTRAHTTYSGYDVHGVVYFDADGITFKDSKVTCGCDPGAVYTAGGQVGAVVDHVEIDLQGNNNTKGVTGPNWTIRATYFHNGADCAHGWSHNLVSDSYCLLTDSLAGGAHVDGFQTDGADGFRVVHNTVRQERDPAHFNPNGTWRKGFGEGTSAIIIDSDLGPTRGVVIDGNLLDDGGYTVYCGPPPGRQYPSETAQFVNNRLGSHHGYGYATKCRQATGNVRDIDGAPLTSRDLE